jgi:O-antigen/teichoic acid export membrane protein
MSKKTIFKSLSFSYLRQVSTIVIGVLSVPLMLNYFGNTLFGIWALILGLTMYLNNISFGIPSAMSTLVAQAINNKLKLNILKKSLYLLTVFIFLLVGIFLLYLFIDTDWIITLLGNIDSQYTDVTKKVFILFVLITLLKLPLNLFMQFFVGMNLVYISEIYQTITVLLGFLALLLTLFFHLNIYHFALLTLGFQFFIGIFSFIHVIVRFKFFQKSFNKEMDVPTQKILHSGFAFFQVGLAASVVWGTDNLVISHFLSAEYVASYTIAFKMFTYIFLFSAIINGVVAPIYGNAYGKKDFETIQTYSMLILKLLPIIGALTWFSLLFFAKDIILLWTQDKDAFGGYLLIFSLGLYGYILSYVNTYATVINSMNFAHKTLSIAWGEAILNLLFSIILIQYFGIGGVALATAFAAFFSGFIFLPKAIAKLTNKKVVFDFHFLKKHFLFIVLPTILFSLYITTIENFFTKFFIYIPLVFIYLLTTWKFLTHDDKTLIFNLLQNRKR